MAFVNLIAEDLSVSSEAEWFMRMRDFVCKRNGTYDYSSNGIGWALHDSSYAVDEDNVAINDWIVIHSQGENGVDDMYYQITLIDNYIRIHGWQYWNNSTHAGSGIEYYRDNAMQMGPDPNQIYIYGDLDFVHLVAIGISGTTTWYCGAFGLLDTNWLVPLDGAARNVQTCSGALSAGSDVSIVVGDTSSDMWRVGNKLCIKDNSNFEQFVVKTNNGSTTMTADLVNSYSAGAKISVMFPYFAVGSNTTHFYFSGSVVMHGMDGAVGGANQQAATIIADTSTTTWPNIQDPGWNDAYGLYPIAVYEAVQGLGLWGYIPHAKSLVGTGLVLYDVLGDITDPSVTWRYVNTTHIRVYKEV